MNIKNHKKISISLLASIRSYMSCFVKTRPKTVFIIKFLFFSVLFFILWTQIGEYYIVGISHISKFLLEGMGYDVTLHHNGEIYFIYRDTLVNLENTELINFNIASFLALILATPRISKQRIIKAIGWGLPVLFVFHVINLVVHFPYYDGFSWARTIISFSGVTNMALPFFLWIAMTYDFMLESFIPKRRIYRCPLCGEKKTGIMEHLEATHQKMNKKEQKKVRIFINNHPKLKRE